MGWEEAGWSLAEPREEAEDQPLFRPFPGPCWGRPGLAEPKVTGPHASRILSQCRWPVAAIAATTQGGQNKAAPPAARRGHSREWPSDPLGRLGRQNSLGLMARKGTTTPPSYTIAGAQRHGILRSSGGSTLLTLRGVGRWSWGRGLQPGRGWGLGGQDPSPLPPAVPLGQDRQETAGLSCLCFLLGAHATRAGRSPFLNCS